MNYGHLHFFEFVPDEKMTNNPAGFPHITQKKQSLDANNISFCVGLPKIDYLCSINPINEFIL